MVTQLVKWFREFFGTPSSSSVAKERLRLVLLSDHLALAPEVIDDMRRDLLEVISRYVEIDEPRSDVSFEHKEQGIAMLASIPILSVKPRERPPQAEHAPEEDTSMLEKAVHANGHSDNYGRPPRRRRRRRKPSGASQTAPAQ